MNNEQPLNVTLKPARSIASEGATICCQNPSRTWNVMQMRGFCLEAELLSPLILPICAVKLLQSNQRTQVHLGRRQMAGSYGGGKKVLCLSWPRCKGSVKSAMDIQRAQGDSYVDFFLNNSISRSLFYSPVCSCELSSSGAGWLKCTVVLFSCAENLSGLFTHGGPHTVPVAW